MKLLYGLVAIINDGNIKEFRDLGSNLIEVKDNVLPVEEIKPDLAENEIYDTYTTEIQEFKVIRTWTTKQLPIIIDYAEFRSRWTSEELAALHTARQNDWRVDDFIGLAQAQGNVNISGSIAPQAKALFVALNVLTSERAEEIFS